MGKVRTILGDINTNKMGFTLPHEHLITRPPNFIVNGDVDLLVDDVTKPVEELKLFKQAGGKSFVEMTPEHYGRNVQVMVEASRATGIHVIATTGFLKGRYFPQEINEWSVTEIADYMIKEVNEGMDGTEHKAGVIKAGTSYNVVTSAEEKVLKAAALAAKETGAPISTHTEKGTMGVEQIEIVMAEDLDPSRIIIGHVDTNLDPYYHLQMVSMGAYIIYDGPGKVKYAWDSQRIEVIKTLIENGFSNRIMLSCDMGRRSYWTSYGGGPGFTYIPEKFVPRMVNDGIAPSDTEMFTITNPANAFALIE